MRNRASGGCGGRGAGCATAVAGGGLVRSPLADARADRARSEGERQRRVSTERRGRPRRCARSAQATRQQKK
eukprot:scaffold15385_cov96-Isochrysis_galbana.AAC.2